ncbi:MAG: glycosyltransferase, partial [Cytophagaceae bacterium]
MMNAPSITLLIPCFNASGQLPRLLEAAHNQTVPFAEIICYDDGSSDDTPDVAARWGARVIRGGTNRGVAVARSRLVEAARTQWVHFHDADDLMATNFVEVMSTHAAQVQLQASQNTVLLCGMTSIHTEEYIQKQRAKGAYKDSEPKAQTFCELNETDDAISFLLQNFVHLNTALFPTEVLRAVGGFCPYLRISEDVDMMVRLAAHK